MGGIFGFLRLDGEMVSQAMLDRMGAALKHRARDALAAEALGLVGLGHCLTRINREDRFEAQPLHDGDLSLVADCRLDNREALAQEFGIDVQTLAMLPDSALVLRAYRRWGEHCVEHLLGDFAIAIWDGQARRLFLARDHMGQRDIYYHLGAGFLAFAPEPKALWAIEEIPRALSDTVVGRLLMHESARGDGETLFEGIRIVAGGETLVIGRDGRIETNRYWRPGAAPEHLDRDEDYYVDAYARILGEAVACRLRRLIKPSGLQFSGGYDSAAVAGLAGRTLGEKGRLIAAASVMPADYTGTIRHARRWADMCARDMPWLDVHYVTREGTDVLTNLDRRMAESQLPQGSYSFVNDALFHTLADAGADQIMDGHGGDYTLNPRGQAAMARLFKQRRWRAFTHEFRAHLRVTRQSMLSTIRRNIIPYVARWAMRSSWRPRPAWHDRPVKQAFAERLVAAQAVDPARLRGAYPEATAMRDRLAEMLEQVASGVSGGIPASYRGLVLTRPYHDKRVVELALAIPEDLYLKNGRERYLACRALADVYPPEFQTRWRMNDDQIPDFQRMSSAIKPQLLAEIARMEKSESLAAMVDFDKIRSLLDVRGADDHASGWEEETQLALSGFTTARYVEWLRRSNS